MTKKLILISVFAVSVFSSNFVLAKAWKHGTVNIVESFKDKIYVRWTGANTESCSSNDVTISASSLGNKEALDRAFKIALTASVSGKPIRFLLDGCSGNLQKGTVVQLCANSDCSY
ncbi:hypothetical protein [Aliiglaciecola litoralis]|uniref:Uncharacterized protein n=1 Tax=Aliiglaciecola litoralis TaxID=582857 RepID=A0ABN1LHW8_9ALTE